MKIEVKIPRRFITKDINEIANLVKELAKVFNIKIEKLTWEIISSNKVLFYQFTDKLEKKQCAIVRFGRKYIHISLNI